MQKFLTAFEDGTEAGLFGIKSHKADYDNVLLSKDFSTVRSYSIHLERPPDIMCSSGLFPTVDFSGRALQDLSDLEVLPKLISFSSFASEKKGAIVFSWLAGSDDTCIPFIMSLHQISDVDLPNALVRFFFESTENLHLSPDWWDGLDEITKIKLIRRISTMANLSVPQSTSPYANDNVEYVDWQIRKRIALGFPLPSNSAATSSELK